MKRAGWLAAICVAALATAVAGTTTAIAQRLDGFSDMHTHPMSHLGFGGMIMFGAPGTGVLMLQRPDGGWFCRRSDRRPSTMHEALVQHHAQQHGHPGDDLGCGDLIRAAIISVIEKSDFLSHPAHEDGAFRSFPSNRAVTHQQMWVDWIRRAHEGGLRVMVALAVNNTLLAKAVNAPTMIHDKESVRLQLVEMARFVNNHGFMEIADSPQKLREIVGRGRLAVVLGVETDDFGDLALRASRGESLNGTKVRQEIDELYGLGVRYILPLHFSNTPLGGYAIGGEEIFALSSKEYTGAFPVVEQSCDRTVGIRYVLRKWHDDSFLGGVARDLLRTRDLGRIIDTQPDYPVRAGCGHINERGLQSLGRIAINHMMDLGMMIDIDHMSQKTIDGVFSIAEQRDYPLNSGHNGPRPEHCYTGGSGNPQECHENTRTREHYQTIRRLGGMVGMGHGNKASLFGAGYSKLVEQMGAPLGIGTDANGLEALPEVDPAARVNYGADFPMYESPAGRRWDYNREGFAHYGMFPDFVRSFTPHMTPRALNDFMSSAEQFARMWEKSANRRLPPAAGVSRRETNWCTHGGAALHVADFNGDGAADLLCRDSGRLWFNYSSRSVPRMPGWPVVPGLLSGATDFHVDTRWCTHATATFHLGDFNGDGRTDLLCKDPGRIWINYADLDGRFADRTSFYLDTHWAWCTEPNARMGLADFNADGRADLFCHEAGKFSILYATPGGAFQDATTVVLRSGSAVRPSQWNRVVESTWCTHQNAVLHVGDFNGDGRADLLCKTPTRIWVNLTDQNGQVRDRTSSVTDTRWCSHAGASLHVGDFNGDGRSDMLCSGGTSFWVRLARDDGSFADRDDWADNTPRCANGRVIVADINGNGRSDFACRSGTSLAVHYTHRNGALAH